MSKRDKQRSIKKLEKKLECVEFVISALKNPSVLESPPKNIQGKYSLKVIASVMSEIREDIQLDHEIESTGY